MVIPIVSHAEALRQKQYINNKIPDTNLKERQKQTGKPCKKARLPAIDYIRGISMLGVIGIHVANQYMLNADASVHIVVILDIAVRWAVPIFFFISAFGLFYNLDMGPDGKTFGMSQYRKFLIRRGRTVMVPYIVWSLFYILLLGAYGHTLGTLTLKGVMMNLFYGNACYQLYFMVLLLWFYLLMPLWVRLVSWCTPARLAGLFMLQLVIDYALEIWDFGPLMSLLGVDAATVTLASMATSSTMGAQSFLAGLVAYRLNFWVIYYFYMFVLGGYLARHMEWFSHFMKNCRSTITLAFWLTMAALLGYFYKLIYLDGYTALQGEAMAHQLSLPGIFYTVTACIFFFTIFTEWRLPDRLRPILAILGRHSYFIYLFHPVALALIYVVMGKLGLGLSAITVWPYYLAVLLVSLAAAIICRKLGDRLPIINQLSIGIYRRRS